MLVNMTWRKFMNTSVRIFALVTHNTDLGGVPVHIKVDVSPQCQLRCPICLHSSLTREERQNLPRQMLPETFTRLVDQVGGRTLVMALYNLGEPLLNKTLPQMIRYAADAGINTYITSNFSFFLSDEKLREIARSGLTMLVVAVDGISEQTFGKQRVNGNWSQIDDNLRRFVRIRGEKGPRVTLQYLVFDHNLGEVAKVKAYCREVGIDDALIVRGTDGRKLPWLKQFAPLKGWVPKSARLAPLCGWPYLSTLVGPDGNVYGCCHYRMDDNYLHADKRRPMGNINSQSMEAIYSSDAYRVARKLSNNPNKNGPYPEHFCHGCPVVQSDGRRGCA